MDCQQDKGNPFTPPQANVDPATPAKRPWPSEYLETKPDFWSELRKDVPLQPVPFEDMQTFPGLWSRLKETVLQAVGENEDFLIRIPLRQGFAKPWQFLALSCLPSLILMIIPARIILAPSDISAHWLERVFDAGGLFLLSLLGVLLLSPILICAGMFIFGTITHGCLWALGGTKAGRGIKQTIRAEGYLLGVFSILQIPLYVLDAVPILGAIFRLVHMVIIVIATIYMGIAVAYMHRTENWRGICAMLITWIVLFLSGLVAAMTLPALLVSGHFLN